jgi:hypothetical protein
MKVVHQPVYSEKPTRLTNQPTNKHSGSKTLFLSFYWLGLLLYPEDGGSMKFCVQLQDIVAEDADLHIQV